MVFRFEVVVAMSAEELIKKASSVCKEHDEQLKYYCETCDELVCIYCTVKKHTMGINMIASN